MPFEAALIFCDLNDTNRAALLERARSRRVVSGEIIFREGDPADTAYVLLFGTCVLSRKLHPLHDARPGDWLDSLATLGGLSHDMTAITTTNCELMCWPVSELWAFDPFAKAARRHLAATLQAAQACLDELVTPVHYTGSAEIQPGPFSFDGMTMVIVLCDADLETVQSWLPEGLSLLRRPGRGCGSVFLALARFPNTYPENRPGDRFTYDETTCFVPVRFGTNFGFYVPFIYPSTWEPILLGREIYGFPKRLGKTTFTGKSVSLVVDRKPCFDLSWGDAKPTRESRLVRALSDWVGIEGRAAEVAFRAGEVLRQVMRFPAYRRIDVYNHKRVLAVDATSESPRYAVNHLTRAVFGVLRWHQIDQLTTPQLMVHSQPFLSADLTLREAYYTRLDMRLSTGETVHDYA